MNSQTADQVFSSTVRLRVNYTINVGLNFKLDIGFNKLEWQAGLICTLVGSKQQMQKIHLAEALLTN